MEEAPEGANKEYWTAPHCTIQYIKLKYGLKKFKPEPLPVTLVRECCGMEFHHTLQHKKQAKTLADYPSFNPERRLRTLVMPFGKFKGLTIPLVYEKQAQYLAWFHESVEGCEDIKEAIRGLDDIETHLTAYRQRRQQPRRQPSKQLPPTQQQVERLLGKFTSQTVDAVCEELFGGETAGQPRNELRAFVRIDEGRTTRQPDILT